MRGFQSNASEVRSALERLSDAGIVERVRLAPVGKEARRQEGNVVKLSRLPLADPRMVCLALLCVAGVRRAASVGQASQPCLGKLEPAFCEVCQQAVKVQSGARGQAIFHS